jgi:hypothetical protein
MPRLLADAVHRDIDATLFPPSGARVEVHRDIRTVGTGIVLSTPPAALSGAER